MRKILLVFLMIVLLQGSAFAASDLVATYKYPDGSMITLCVRDTKHIRMDTSPDSYMLFSGGKIYSVYNDDGQLQVMDMDQAMGMASGFKSLFGLGKDAPKSTIKYTKTGRTETVAGYKGIVYNVTITEGENIVRQEEVVMSDHSDLKKINDGWVAIASHMGQMMGKEMAQFLEQSAEESKSSGYGGILRYGNDMKLESLQKKSLSASYYELPSTAQQVQIQQPPQQSNEYGMDDELKQDAKDIGSSAKSEAKDSVVDEVREGVRSVFKGLFD